MPSSVALGRIRSFVPRFAVPSAVFYEETDLVAENEWSFEEKKKKMHCSYLESGLF